MRSPISYRQVLVRSAVLMGVFTLVATALPQIDSKLSVKLSGTSLVRLSNKAAQPPTPSR
jgi:hypothetical protein